MPGRAQRLHDQFRATPLFIQPECDHVVDGDVSVAGGMAGTQPVAQRQRSAPAGRPSPILVEHRGALAANLFDSNRLVALGRRFCQVADFRPETHAMDMTIEARAMASRSSWSRSCSSPGLPGVWVTGFWSSRHRRRDLRRRHRPVASVNGGFRRRDPSSTTTPRRLRRRRRV